MTLLISQINTYNLSLLGTLGSITIFFDVVYYMIFFSLHKARSAKLPSYFYITTILTISRSFFKCQAHFYQGSIFIFFTWSIVLQWPLVVSSFSAEHVIIKSRCWYECIWLLNTVVYTVVWITWKTIPWQWAEHIAEQSVRQKEKDLNTDKLSTLNSMLWLTIWNRHQLHNL